MARLLHSAAHLGTNDGARALFITRLSIRSSPSFTLSAFPPLRLDPVVLENSLDSSLNLVTLCGFIGFMQKLGHLPPTTPSVLSQVSFNLIIPSFLMSKVCLTIASHRERSFIFLPLVAIVQIIVGVILGRLSCLFLFRKVNNMKPKEDRYAITKEALVTAACAFGNSVTLPLVFLNGVLPQTDYGSAAGYLALFLIGWSPCLWTLGYQIMSSNSTGSDVRENAQRFSWLKNLMNPPLYGVLFGVLLGSSPLMHFIQSPNLKHGLLQFSSHNTKILNVFGYFLTRIMHSILEAAKLLGSATVPLQAIVLASTLASSINHIPVPKAVGREEYTNITGSVNDFNLDTKACWAIAVIRLLIMPVITLMLLIVIPQEWMPADRIARLTILVVSAMPTAQNLLVLAQLHSDTRPFAGAIANLLVKQYAISVVTITAWMPIFLSYLSIN